ncbi:MAG: hypothetical protein LUI12_04050 [Clostridiales bacterium]|nr:hypothetical protein [Clostridiales bacterium]
MLKLRLQGTKEDITRFVDFLKGSPRIRIIQMSDIYANKGANRYFRLYAEIETVEFKEDKDYE